MFIARLNSVMLHKVLSSTRAEHRSPLKSEFLAIILNPLFFLNNTKRKTRYA